jgi:hypothetical protein
MELVPNCVQARRLVTSLALFWASWGVAVSALGIGVPAAFGVAIVVALSFGFRFYFVLYGIWEPETGESAWRMMLVPKLSRDHIRGSRHLFDLFRPKWIRQTLRATEWDPRIPGFGLLALLIADLVLAVTVLPHLSQ